jgi:PKD repeat protein
MKKIVLAFIAILFGVTIYADGWRPGEQQIKINIENQEQVLELKNLKIDFEPCGDNVVRAYVVPKERLIIESLGFITEIEINDLNKHFETFWLSEDFYHSYQQIINLADSLEEHFPGICKKFSFGTSLGGRQLAALKISDNVLTDENEPEIFFDGGIHGDEIGGSENIIRFARDLCLDYENNGTITDLINNREIWLYLMVNPDGRVNMVRQNNNGVDLNRDCGYMWDQDGSTYGPFEEVESKALRLCNLQNQFVIYTSYHSGTEYISYPWSYRPDASSDYAHTNQLAQLYADLSGYSNIPYGQGYSGMYPINGSSKDAYYGLTGSVSWSIEISLSKQPPASQIMMYYNYNKPSMLGLIEYAGYGLQGTVTDANTGNPVSAVIFVDNYYPCYADPEVGDYHKYVLPGTYNITVKANGYETQTISNVTVTAGSAATTDFQLVPSDGQFAYKVLTCKIPGNNFSDEGFTPAALGAPDNINYSLGKNGYCILDMQQSISDGPGNDILIYEGDATPEGYTCYIGSTIDGPWISIGTGSGTKEFDFAGSGLTESQYIKMLDDGDGTANEANAGFDLDAIEALVPISGVYLVMTAYSVDDSNGNNNGLIDPGETMDVIIEIQNNGNITASNISGEITTGSPFVTITNAVADFGTLAQGESSEGTYELLIDPATPAGESFSLNLITEANGGTYTNSFLMSFSVGLIVEDWESGDFSQFEWETSGNSSWTITNTNPYEGIYSARSGVIGDDQSSELSITYFITANSVISFFKKVSSEADYDFLSFYIDNSLQQQWSGESAWSEVSFPVASGLHTFSWKYTKDVSVSSGSDAGWIDYIILPPGASQGLIAFFNSDQTEICEAETISFTDLSSGNITSWNWSFPGGTPSESTIENPSIVYYSAGSYDVSLTISDGNNSQTITLEDYINVSAVPQIPDTPVGEEYPMSNPGYDYEYTTSPVSNADSYEWIALPEEAVESIINNGNSCILDFTDYWEGNFTLKVKALNECGESEFSEELDLYVIWLKTEEIRKNEFIISPNPSDGVFKIEFEEAKSDLVEVRVSNNLGEIIYGDKIRLSGKSNIIEMNLGEIEPGLYYIVLLDKNGMLTKKLIIQ